MYYVTFRLNEPIKYIDKKVIFEDVVDDYGKILTPKQYRIVEYKKDTDTPSIEYMAEGSFEIIKELVAERYAVHIV